MSQFTIYVPDDLAREIKQRAKRERTSVSAYLASLVRGASARTEWPASFLSSFGAWKGEHISAAEELPLERRSRMK